MQGRYILTTPDTEKGVDILSRVFGIVSVSPVEEFPSELDRLCDAVGGWSRDKLGRGASFAIRARRTGTHPYTSMDVNKQVGSAVFLANEDKGVKVDLTSPDVLIEVEIRGRSAFVYTDRVEGPGGLPYGSGGRMVCYLRNQRDALGAWMLMRRGCRMFFYHPDEAEAEVAPMVVALARWVHGLGSRPLSALVKEKERPDEGNEEGGGKGALDAPILLRRAMVVRRATGFVTGATLREVEDGAVVRPEGSDILVLYPLVGLGEEEMAEMRERAGL